MEKSIEKRLLEGNVEKKLRELGYDVLNEYKRAYIAKKNGKMVGFVLYKNENFMNYNSSLNNFLNKYSLSRCEGGKETEEKEFLNYHDAIRNLVILAERYAH